MNIVTGILFNHESFKRSENYLTKKLAKAVARISLGIDKTVAFGDLDTEVDWGCASEFTRFFCDLMETDYVGDIVIGTGQLTKVQDLVKDAFQYKDLDFRDFVTQDRVYAANKNGSNLRRHFKDVRCGGPWLGAWLIKLLLK